MLNNLVLSFLPFALAVSLPQMQDLPSQGSSNSSSYFFEGNNNRDEYRQGSFVYMNYSSYGDMDDEDKYNEDEFEQEFGLDPITDPEEKEKRKEALRENEEIVKKENKAKLSFSFVEPGLG